MPADAHTAALSDDPLALVTAALNRFPSCSHEQEELYQQGCIGLMKAAARFDPAWDISFPAYSVHMILREMYQLCRLETPCRMYPCIQALTNRVRNAEAMLLSHLHRAPTIGELALALRMNTPDLLLALEDAQLLSSSSPQRRKVARDFSHQAWYAPQLSKNDQRLLLLRFRFSCTQSEVARRLGLSPAQISRRELAIKRSLAHAAQE